MADSTRFRCLLLFFLINTCNGSIPGLDDNSSPIGGVNNQLANTKMVHQPRHKCHQCEWCDPEAPVGAAEGEVCGAALYCFKASVRSSDGSIRHSRGCTAKDDQYQLICWTNREPSVRKRHLGQLNVTCCRGDLCNDGDFPALEPPVDASAEKLGAGVWPLWASAAAGLLGIAVLGAALLLLRRRVQRGRVSRAAHKLGSHVSRDFYPSMYSAHVTSSTYSDGPSSGSVRAVAVGDSTLRQYLEVSATSGSGSGLPLMVQRSLAKQVELYDCVGKGRFGEVWRGLWYSEDVAVKVFFSRDEASWQRETEIYSTVLLRHENILAYLGSDMTSRNSCTQLWLVTQYHPLGSLYDQLCASPVSRQQMLVFALSTTSGLLHLHTEIHGAQGKPAIAHRDIKSKNILVKSNGECCIADLGLAITSDSPVTDIRQGTRRYMSPEMLDQSMNIRCFESYLRCDVYALALVLWEIFSRCSPAAREYRPPFGDMVSADPSFEDMRKIVCVDGARPHCAPSDQPTMRAMSALLGECWHQKPSVRLSALRIKKSLMQMAQADDAVSLRWNSAGVPV